MLSEQEQCVILSDDDVLSLDLDISSECQPVADPCDILDAFLDSLS